jgi:hypothetical protein
VSRLLGAWPPRAARNFLPRCYDKVRVATSFAEIAPPGVYYHDPATIQNPSTYVATITKQDLRQDLTQNGLNEQGLVEEFYLLQQFLAKTSAGNQYCIYYVG